VAFKGLIAAATSVALMTAPTVALAQASAAASASVAREVAPATETVEGSELRGGFIIPLLALIAILLGLCATDVICGSDDDLPTSP
jgi:hypothetical protein